MAHFSGGLTDWASVTAGAHSKAMRTHQNSSLTSAFTADSNAELSGVVRMEEQESVFSLCYLLQKILMYARTRAVHSENFSCSLSGPGLYLSDFREFQDCTGSGHEESQLFLLSLQTYNKVFTDL